MCRAIGVLVVAPGDERCARLRRAAGADVEVIAGATSRDEALAKAEQGRIDAVVIDDEVADAGALAESLRTAGMAVVLVGPGADVLPDDPAAVLHRADDDAAARLRKEVGALRRHRAAGQCDAAHRVEGQRG